MLDMKIEDYRITSDSRQITLSKVRRDEEGNIRYIENSEGQKEESRVDIGYYQTLSMSLRAIQRDYTQSEGTVIKSIIEYKKALERITRHFENECEIEGEKNG
ncbi:hypothetical protein JQC73_05350 [Enterococcus durans]|uniref:hypothetical protein n=1 Tax=Enterococcus durans TaxID=53345 RepID=UPI00193BB7D9|nr:hypothetical protein [Enterococcus durans]MBM1152363.1 hypothetical protein [Enterococcus durans]